MGEKVLITGGAGFIGCNLADRLASEGCDVVIYDALLRPGAERNLAWLQARHGSQITALTADVRDRRMLTKAVGQASVIFHLAAQVAVTTSLANPSEDFAINLIGTLNVLEAVRAVGSGVPVIFASTNKVYGDLGDVTLELVEEAYRPLDPSLRARGVSEARPLAFHTPYGCSKGAADQYVLDYARSFGVPTCVLRMSCIYGPHQMGVEEQGWVAHLLICALEGRPITIFGDGRQVRDILEVSDAVQAYVSAWRRIDQVAGRAFNLGGGVANAVSLLQLIGYVEQVLDRKVALSFADWRLGDQRYYVCDPSAARRALALSEPQDWRTGVAALAQWLAAERAGRRSRRQRAEAVT